MYRLVSNTSGLCVPGMAQARRGSAQAAAAWHYEQTIWTGKQQRAASRGRTKSLQQAGRMHARVLVRQACRRQLGRTGAVAAAPAESARPSSAVSSLSSPTLSGPLGR